MVDAVEEWLMILVLIVFIYIILNLIRAVVGLIGLKFTFGTPDKWLKQEKEYRRYLTKQGMNLVKFDREIDEIIETNEQGKMSDKTSKILDEKIQERVSKELDLCIDFLKENPNNLYAIEQRANLYSQNGMYYDAINDYRYLMRKEPNNSDHVQQCAKTYAKLNDFETAIALINRFYKNKKQNDKYFYALGNLYSEAKNYEPAIKYYTEAINLNPDNENYYFKRAYLYFDINDKEKYNQDMKMHSELLNQKLEESRRPLKDIENDDSASTKRILTCVIISILAILITILYSNYANANIYDTSLNVFMTIIILGLIFYIHLRN